jgi:hypothetical protein
LDSSTVVRRGSVEALTLVNIERQVTAGRGTTPL